MKTTALLALLKKWLPLEGAWFGTAKIDNTKEKAICLYARGKGAANNIAVGGLAATGYRCEPMTLLVRWTKDALKAEETARKVYDAVCYKDFVIDGKKSFLQAVYAAAVPLGTDNKGVYEYSIDFDIYHEKIL
jgi:hypothetical protein